MDTEQETAEVTKETIRTKAIELLRDLFKEVEMRDIAWKLLREAERAYDKTNKASSFIKMQCGSYYKAEYGNWIKEVVDEMMQDEERMAREFRYEDFPGISKTTLYLQINQGKRYLLENLDPDGKYAEFWRTMRVDQTHIDGIWIYQKSSKLPEVLSKGRALEYKSQWQEEMETWLNNPKGPKEYHKIVSLDEDEVRKLQLSFEDVPNIFAYIAHNEIKLVRVNINK